MYLSNDYDRKTINIILPIIIIILLSPIFLRIFRFDSERYMHIKWYLYSIFICLIVFISVLLPCFVSRISIKRFFISPYVPYFLTILFIGTGSYFFQFYFDDYNPLNISITLISYLASSILIENDDLYKNRNKIHDFIALFLRIFSRCLFSFSVAIIYKEFLI